MSEGLGFFFFFGGGGRIFLLLIFRYDGENRLQADLNKDTFTLTIILCVK